MQGKFPFFAISIALLLLYTIGYRGVTHAQESPTPSQISTRIESDKRLIISVPDDSSFLSTYPHLSAFIAQSACVGDTSQDQLIQKMYSGEICADSLNEISLSQAGSYDSAPSQSSLIIIGYCKNAQNNCPEHPSEFIIHSIQEFQETQNPTDASHPLVSLTQIPLTTPAP